MSHLQQLPDPVKIILNGILNEPIERILSKAEIEEVIRLIEIHRVVGPFHKNYSSIGNPELIEKVNNLLYVNKLSQLKLCSELIRIGQEFDNNNIEFIALKGPALSMLIYDDPTERTSRDLDLMIDLKDLDRCIELLNDLGYSRISYFNSAKQKAAFIKHYHHVEFYNDELDVTVELHYRISSFRNEQNYFSDIIDKTDFIEISSFRLRTLQGEYLLEYLSIHGTLHTFFRIQWLADIYFLLKKQGLHQIKFNDHLGDLSIRTALNLCNTLLKFDLTEELKTAIKKDKRVTKLTDISIREIDLNRTINPNPKSFKGKWKRLITIHRVQYLTGGMPALIKSVFGRNVRPANWKFFAFPDSVFFLNNLFSRIISLIGSATGKI